MSPEGFFEFLRSQKPKFQHNKIHVQTFKDIGIASAGIAAEELAFNESLRLREIHAGPIWLIQTVLAKLKKCLS